MAFAHLVSVFLFRVTFSFSISVYAFFIVIIIHHYYCCYYCYCTFMILRTCASVCVWLCVIYVYIFICVCVYKSGAMQVHRGHYTVVKLVTRLNASFYNTSRCTFQCFNCDLPVLCTIPRDRTGVWSTTICLYI